MLQAGCCFFDANDFLLAYICAIDGIIFYNETFSYLSQLAFLRGIVKYSALIVLIPITLCHLSLRLPHEFHLNLDRKSTRLNSSHVSISYAVFCLKKKKINKNTNIKSSNKTRAYKMPSYSEQLS